MKNNKGFSLVELIIVVAIMAVLMGILAPQYIRYVEKTRIRADDSIVADIDKAAQITLAGEKYYEDAAGDVVLTVDLTTGGVSVTNLPNTTAAFVNEVYTSVYGTNAAANKFKSKAYASATSVVFTYHFDTSLYTWTAKVTTGNGIADSKYELATP